MRLAQTNTDRSCLGKCDLRVTARVLKEIIMKNFKALLRDEAGATAIEYGLIAALIAVAVMTTVSGLGKQLNTTFSKTSSQLSSANA